MALTRTTSSRLLSRSRGSFNRLVFESEHSIGGGSSDRSILFRLCQLVVRMYVLHDINFIDDNIDFDFDNFIHTKEVNRIKKKKTQ